MKKKDIILLVSLVIAGALLLALFSAITRDTGEIVLVLVDGEEYARLPLGEDAELIIEGVGGTNTLVIKDGEAYMTHADCPDLLCVKSGKATELKTIVCLPHRVTVSIEKGQ